NVDAGVAPKLRRDAVLHGLNALLQRVLRIGFVEEVAPAGEIEAEVDLVLREPFGPACGQRRVGDQARDRQQYADRDDKRDGPDFPAGEIKHRSGLSRSPACRRPTGAPRTASTSPP